MSGKNVGFYLGRIVMALLAVSGLLLPSANVLSVERLWQDNRYAGYFHRVGLSTSTTSQSGESPLPVEGYTDFYQRILSLPDARLLDKPGENGRVITDPIPVFNIYYVFQRTNTRGESWVRVGTRPNRSEGWINASYVEDWKNMVVLEFAPHGQRNRVLFFEDKQDIKQLLQEKDDERTFMVSEYYSGIELGTAPPGKFAAIEPPFQVAQGRRDDRSDYRYFLPVLDWETGTRFKHGSRPRQRGPYATLVQVAMVNTSDHQAMDPHSPEGREYMADTGGMSNMGLQDMKVGVVFVVDTTASMGPYIKRVRDLIHQVYRRLEDSSYRDHIRYGLVAYRDNLSHNPRIEYVTKVFQELDPISSPGGIIEKLRQVKPSPVSTKGWDEDAFAGIKRAIDEDWWGAFQGRFIILVTDAGARSPHDPNASTTAGAIELRTLANEKKIVIIPMHLKTEQARKKGNVYSAEEQYRKLADTGDRNKGKYREIEAGDVKYFGRSLDEMTDGIVQALDRWSRGVPTERPKIIESDTDLITNELFRTQMEYLGDRRGQEIPRFYRGWAVDKDLMNPANSSFSINILLTRAQLSALAKAVDGLLDKMYTRDLSSSDFLDQIQGLAATLSVDPNRGNTIGTPRLGDALPAWLKQIPYQSDILMLTADEWVQQGEQQRNLYTSQLEEKAKTYRELERDSDRWLRRGDRDADELGSLGVENLP